jgi:hypothetical protein
MNQTLTLNDWLAGLCFGISGCAVWSGVFLLVVDADLKDFDPRPTLRRVAESPAADRLLIEVVNARHALAAWALALSLRLATPHTPGATR